jgi:hypothetical protein
MKEDKEIEKILLNDENYEKFVNSKNEKDYLSVLEKEKNKSESVITDIKKVPQNFLFSKDSVFVVINKISKTKSYINGIQADGFLAGQNVLRERLKSGSTDSFISGNCYIKFYKYKAVV